MSLYDFPQENITIDEFYVMPEYRGNNIFIDTIIEYIKLDDREITLRNPSKQVVKILLDNNLAKKYSKDVVYSYIRFSTSLDKIYKNNKIKNIYKNDITDLNMVFFCDSYDLYLGTIILFDNHGLIAKNQNAGVIMMPRKLDMNKEILNGLRRIDKLDVYNLFKNFTRLKDDLEYFDVKIERKLFGY